MCGPQFALRADTGARDNSNLHSTYLRRRASRLRCPAMRRSGMALFEAIVAQGRPFRALVARLFCGNRHYSFREHEVRR